MTVEERVAEVRQRLVPGVRISWSGGTKYMIKEIVRGSSRSHDELHCYPEEGSPLTIGPTYNIESLAYAIATRRDWSIVDPVPEPTPLRLTRI